MSAQTFLAIGGLFATRETEKATIDDFPFRLQYKVATAVAFLASVLLSATELVRTYFSSEILPTKQSFYFTLFIIPALIALFYFFI